MLLETKKVEASEHSAPHLLHARTMSKEEWIERHGSGTLRKNTRLGMRTHSQYLEERTAWEFGWEFRAIPASRVTVGDVWSEGDSAPLTELGWHLDRLIELRRWPEDKYVPAYFHVNAEHEAKTEGCGILVAETSCPWLPPGYIVFCLTCVFDPVRGCWGEPLNPA